MKPGAKRAAIALGLLALALGLSWRAARSRWFKHRLESYVIAQIFRATGAHAEMAGLQVQLRPLGLTVNGLVLHGREPVGEAPLAAIPRVAVGLDWGSLMSARVKLDRLDVSAPVFHLFRMRDGGSNLPQAPPARPAQPLFDVGLHQLRVHDGVLLLQDRRLPLELDLRGLGVQLSADAPTPALYHGSLAFAAGEIQLGAKTAVNGSLQMRFTLGPDDLGLDEAVLTTLGSRIELHGAVHHLDAPEIDAQYLLAGPVKPWLRMLPGQAIGLGQVRATGSLHWRAGDWMSAGNFQATGLRPAEPGWPALAAKGEFRAVPAGLDLNRVEVTGLGAHLELSGRLDHWQELRLNGRLAGFRLAALWPAWDRTRSRTLRARLAQLDGNVAGDVTITGAPPAHLAWDLDLQITPEAAPGLYPLSGHVQVHLEPARDLVEIKAASLSLPTTMVSGNGTVTGDRLALQAKLDSGDLSELDRLVHPWLPPVLAAEPLAGIATFAGEIGGTVTHPTLAGELTASRTTLMGVEVDRLEAAGTLASNELDLSRSSFAFGRQTAALHGWMELEDYQPTAVGRLSLTLTARNFDVAAAERFAGLDYPISGTFNLDATISGSRAHPAGTAAVAVAGARWRAQPLGTITGNLRFGGGTAEIDALSVRLGPSLMTGKLGLDLDHRTFAVSLQADAVHLADVAALQSSRLALRGQARISVTGSGPWLAPQATIRVTTLGLSGNGESLGDAGAVLEWDGATLHFQASDVMPEGSLQLTGQMAWSAPHAVDARLVVHDYDMDALLQRFTSVQVTGHSHIEGEADIRGPLDNPALLQAHASFDPVEMAISGLVLRNQGPVQLAMDQGRLRVASAHFAAPDSDFSFTGAVSLRPGAPLDGTIGGQLNLALLSSIQANTHATGTVAIAGRVGGTLAAPQLTGSLSVHNGTLTEENFPIGFDHIEGRVQFTGNRVQIDSLTAQTGGGNLSLSGFAARTPTGAVYDVTATGHRLRLRYQGMTATGDVNLRLNGTQRSGLVSGDVELTGMGLNDNFDLALFIASNKTQPALPNPNSLLNQVRLDVHLQTGPEVEVATSAAHLQLQGDLRLRGTAATPSIVGRITAPEGQLMFGGIQYRVDKGSVLFVNPFRIEPQLDLALSATVQEYDVSLQMSGPVDKLNISYRSDPPLSSTDVLALLATGQPTQADAALNQQSTNAFVGPSEQLLGRALDNVVSGRLHQLFGITQIQVNPNTGPTGIAGTGSSVTVQEQVSRDVKLTYTQNLSSSAQDILQVEWSITRFFGIVLNRDSFGLYGLSFEFRHRAR